MSLHAPSQELREQLMPKAAKALPLPKLMDVLRQIPLKPRENITFEYVLLGGVNDSPQQARDLVRLLSHIKGKVNLIAYNESPGLPYKSPDPSDVEAFQKVLWDKGITVTLRKSKGRDIFAACGNCLPRTSLRKKRRVPPAAKAPPWTRQGDDPPAPSGRPLWGATALRGRKPAVLGVTRLNYPGFTALKSIPTVTGELLNPVSPWQTAPLNPASDSMARNAVPGTAPPRQVNQEATLSAWVMGAGPVSTWSAIWIRPPGLSTRKASARARVLSITRL